MIAMFVTFVDTQGRVWNVERATFDPNIPGWLVRARWRGNAETFSDHVELTCDAIDVTLEQAISRCLDGAGRLNTPESFRERYARLDAEEL